MGAASSVSGSGGEFSALSRSGQVAVVGGVSVGVGGLLASVLAALDGRSAGLSAAMGTPKSTCRLRYGRSSWMHLYRTVGRPSSVTRALRMCAALAAVTAGSTSASEWLSTVTSR